MTSRSRRRGYPHSFRVAHNHDSPFKTHSAMKTMNPVLKLAAVSAIGLLAVGCGRNTAPESTVVLDAGEAARLAATLANFEARRQFDAAPFGASLDTPKLSDGRWKWEATAGYGKGDLQVVVTFTKAGSNPKVSIQPLVLEVEQKATELPRFKER
jgi:hypothetical protein